MFIQKAAAAALMEYRGRERPPSVQRNVDIYQERRDVIVEGLRQMGFDVAAPKGTFYLWFQVDEGSMDFAERMLEVGIVVTPGVGFGKYGEGYIRLALTQPVKRIEEALERMRKVL